MRFWPVFLLALAAPALAGDYPFGRPQHKIALLDDASVYTGSGASPAPAKSLDQLPVAFNWGNVDGKSFLTPSWNQHIPNYCGSCYIHGALSQLNDRIKIAFNGTFEVMLARQVMVNCGPAHGLGAGCNGGEGFDVFEFVHRYGLPDETCQIYTAQDGQCNHESICQNCMPIGESVDDFKCWPVINPTKFYVSEYGRVHGEAAMMSEILANGPITCVRGVFCV